MDRWRESGINLPLSMADAAGLLTKLREAYKKKDLKSGKSLLGQIKVFTTVMPRTSTLPARAIS